MATMIATLFTDNLEVKRIG